MLFKANLFKYNRGFNIYRWGKIRVSQTKNGKAFEYAILSEFNSKLSTQTKVQVIENNSYKTAKKHFDESLPSMQSDFLLSASFAVNFLMDVEPCLHNDLGLEDILQLEILADRAGQDGDVRDVIAIRALQKWEIGVSAKNNHNAVKHSRLSNDINFGHKWIQRECSEHYFTQIKPVFDKLSKIKSESNRTALWKSLGDYHTSVYIPILNAFKDELLRIYAEDPEAVAKSLVNYLVGTKDFYKVIRSKSGVEVQAYNLHGSLNKAFRDIQPKFKCPVIELPTKITDLSFKKDSANTLLLQFDKNWEMSFRIHNASSKVEPSLKFDINLTKAPKTLFKNKLSISK